MPAREQVLEAALARAAALAAGDAAALTECLHPEFRWTSHTGESFDRDSYVAANTGGRTEWLRQDLGEAEVTVVGDAAVLHTVVEDTVQSRSGPKSFRMPMTQLWVRTDAGWRCLAGHAGPRLTGS